jgi:hypothetical protein
MGWKWDLNQPPIHVYFSDLWSVNYRKNFYDLCNLFLAPLHSILFGFPRHKISFKTIYGMKGLADWFPYKYYSYIRVYGTTRALHLFTYFVLDHLLMREISYQTMGSWVTTLFQISSKKLWPVFPIHIRSYTISNCQHARKEEEALQELIQFLGEPKGHDPHEITIIHVKVFGLTHSSIHVVDFEEEKFKGILSYDEIMHNLPHDVSKHELECKQEEIKRETLNHFQIFFSKSMPLKSPKNRRKPRRRKIYNKKESKIRRQTINHFQRLL